LFTGEIGPLPVRKRNTQFVAIKKNRFSHRSSPAKKRGGGVRTVSTNNTGKKEVLSAPTGGKKGRGSSALYRQQKGRRDGLI